jgi:molecular chaperone DnaK (HSP70)
MDDTRQVFGIDLGTTYSCVAQVDKYDQPVVLRNFEGFSTTPSVVYFSSDNKVIVGEEAKGMLPVEPHQTVSFVKRSISEDSAYDNKSKFPNGLDPTEISAYILKKIVKDANDASQNPVPVTKVVITCPAYFGHKERLRTKQAGEIAGLDVLAIINEPTAAAIAYGMKVQDEKVIMVYDLGGGTFDVTIIRVKGGTITVITTGGDHHLGGVDWDMALAEYLLSVYNKENKTSYSMSDIAIKNQLLLTAEDKKKSLSGERSNVNAIITIGGVSSRIPVTRAIFDQLTEAKLEETIDKAREVIERAKEKGYNKIDEFLLVGGSSRMLQVKEKVDSVFQCDAKLTDPDECVAKGAAIYAINESFAQAMEKFAEGKIEEKPQLISSANRTRVVNVTSKNYGLGCVNEEGEDIISNIILSDTPLDGNCRGEKTFSTSVDNQTGIIFPIYESDVHEEITEPIPSGKLEEHVMPLTRKWPKGTPIKVSFEIDVEGLLHVHGETGPDSIDFQLKVKGVKSREEIEQSKALLAKSDVE